MSSSPVVQLDPTSVDLAGVSVATATPTLEHPRWGSAYNLVNFAAAVPVWFHPMPGGDFLMINARRWYGATTVSTTPGVYSDYSEDVAPSWRQLTLPTGFSSTPNGQPDAIPFNVAVTSPTVIAGVSRPPALLFLLHSGTVAQQSAAILQRFHLGINGSIALAQEEVVPTVNGVVFNQGLQYDSPNLVLYGTDNTHQVYKVTKPWGRVGFNRQLGVQTTKISVPNAVGSQLGWQYYTGTGYSADPTELAPIAVAGGDHLISYGPLSFGTLRNQTLMTTVGQSGSTYTAQVWRSLSGRPYSPYGSPITLGSSSDDSYLGVGLPLQAQLAANPTAAVLGGAGVLSGIPYALPTFTAPTGGHSLDVSWNILPVTG